METEFASSLFPRSILPGYTKAQLSLTGYEISMPNSSKVISCGVPNVARSNEITKH